MLTPAQEQLIRSGVMAVNRLSGLIERLVEAQGEAAPQFMNVGALAERHGVNNKAMRQWLVEHGMLTKERARAWAQNIILTPKQVREVAEVIEKEGGFQLRDGGAGKARAKRKRGPTPVARRSAPPSGD